MMWLRKLFKRRKKTALKDGMINLRCIHCGCGVDTDTDHIQIFCPFCGNELFVPAGYYKDLKERYDQSQEDNHA